MGNMGPILLIGAVVWWLVDSGMFGTSTSPGQTGTQQPGAGLPSSASQLPTQTQAPAQYPAQYPAQAQPQLQVQAPTPSPYVPPAYYQPDQPGTAYVPPPLTASAQASAEEQRNDPEYVQMVTVAAATSDSSGGRYPAIARQWNLQYTADEWNWFAAQGDSTRGIAPVVRPGLVIESDRLAGGLKKIGIDEYLVRVQAANQAGLSGYGGMTSTNTWTM